MSQWVRRTHFQKRARHLYALVFDQERAVYIGQTVNPKQRASQHRAAAGGWLRPHRMVLLEAIEGTYAQAEEREYVWRWVAHIKGWRVYVQPPNMVVNLGRRMGLLRRLEAWRTLTTRGWKVQRTTFQEA